MGQIYKHVCYASEVCCAVIESSNYRWQIKLDVMVNPSLQLSPTQPLAHSPPCQDVGVNWESKSEKNHGLR